VLACSSGGLSFSLIKKLLDMCKLKNFNYIRGLQLFAIILIFIGTFTLAKDLMITKEEAVMLGKPSVQLGGAEDNFEKYKNYPPVVALWKQSKSSYWGIILIGAGTILQTLTLLLVEPTPRRRKRKK